MTSSKTAPWPTMRPVTVRPRHAPELVVGASVSLGTGKPIVDFRYGYQDEDALTPAEARRLAAALNRAADCCDAKTAHAKAARSTPVASEARSGARRR